MGDMWIELLPISLGAMVLGLIAGSVRRDYVMAFALASLTTYVAQNVLYALWPPITFDSTFLRWFFVGPSVAAGVIVTGIVAWRGRGRYDA